MKTTNEVSLAVVFIAWRNRLIDRRRRTSAIASAPLAPMAPPSVGVATPRKIVPSTRKISASGGISTKVTRSAIRESRRSLNTWLATEAVKATPTPTAVDKTSNSSIGGLGSG